jgi:hypothetical protein
MKSDIGPEKNRIFDRIKPDTSAILNQKQKKKKYLEIAQCLRAAQSTELCSILD